MDSSVFSLTGDADSMMAGALYDDAPGLPRLQELAARLPPGYQLRTKLESAAGFLTAGRPYFATKLGPSEAMFPFAEALWAGGIDRLTAEDADKLWRQAASRGRREVMLALADREIPAPAEFPVLLGLAQAMYEAGRNADAEQVLIEARSTWWPLAAWDTLPTNPMLDPGLRPIVTDRVRDAYLNSPIGYQG